MRCYTTGNTNEQLIRQSRREGKREVRMMTSKSKCLKEMAYTPVNGGRTVATLGDAEAEEGGGYDTLAIEA